MNFYYQNASYQENNSGIDFSLEGQITPYWQTSIGYAYTKKKYKQKPENGATAISGLPWQVKFSNQFNLSGNDILNKITLGASTSFLSKRNEQRNEYRTEERSELDREIINLKMKSYAVTDIFARYQINDNWSAQLNINNVFDKKYVNSSVPISSGIGFYGNPVNYLFTLQSKF